MPISIIDPVLSTGIFIAIFSIALLASIRRKKDQALFPLALTQELKGLAILAVVFSHIGYFLSNDQRFLFPLSIMAGVGVNLFLFLSGYGLTMSSLKRQLSIGAFYKKRLLRLFTPFWIVIIILFLADYFFLHISYGWTYIIQSLLGFFPRANLYLDVNSPFWFFTPLLFYYLIFPWLFFSKHPWLTAIGLYAASVFVINLRLPVTPGVLDMYQVHLLAFPLGIAFASLFFEPFNFSRFAPDKVKTFLYELQNPVWLKATVDRFRAPSFFHRLLKKMGSPFYYLILAILLLVIGHMAYHSGVGDKPAIEQAISLLTMGMVILFFILKKFDIKFLYVFGIYSYEIYLFHWPLMYRYDIFFKWLPGWLAMSLYLGLFLGLAWLLEKLLARIHRQKPGARS